MMSVCPESVSMSSLGKSDSLHQQVLAAFPLCQLSEEDLIQNPRFCKLLATLSLHVDRTGLTVALTRELEKAEQELRAQRLGWLRPESLHTLLQEMLQQHCVRKHHAAVPPDEDKFYGTLEQCLVVAQCVRRLDPRSTTTEEEAPILGLSAKQVLNQMPPEQDIRQMKQRLPTELQKHLKKKALSLLDYYQPEWENESEGLKSAKLSHLPELLESERKRTHRLTEKNRENATVLQQLTHAYLTELLGCLQILQALVLDCRLKAQTDLDRKMIEYLEIKCEIGMQKIRSEMLELQLQTYTKEKISTHRRVVEKLNAELKSTQAEKESAESKVASFELLGREFEALAEEYARLRQEIDTKTWALNEFTKHSD